MHPCLSEWPSNMFYEGTLQNGVTEGERVMDQVSYMMARKILVFVSVGRVVYVLIRLLSGCDHERRYPFPTVGGRRET